MRAVGVMVLAICSAWLFSQPALADKRVALVIGNSGYQNVSRLTNPVNDAAAMSATLKGAGFDVVDLKRDLKANEMRRALRDFSDRVRNADIAIVYFAGHGIEIDGVNYLIPVDAVLERDIDAFDEAIPLDRLLTVIEPAKQLRLVILDACRDNPFGKTMKRSATSRSVGRGLAKVEPTNPNTLIAFAAKAGSTASDGDSTNSPFTAALVRYLPRPGLDLRKAFGFARDEVLKVTNNKQEPFIYGSLGGDDVALVSAVVVPPPATSLADPNAAIRRDYELALQINTRPIWDSFIGNYPSGFYADLAKAQRDRLSAEVASAAATEKAKAAVEAQKRLALEGAAAIEQAKAAAQAKAAEDARVAAENKKVIEEAKVIEAERAKAAAQAKAAEDVKRAAEKARKIEEAKAAEAARIAAVKQKAIEDSKATEAERAKAVAQAKAAEEARVAADRAKIADEKNGEADKPIGQLAALTPSEQADETLPKTDKPAAAELPRLLQTELRRVGCNTGAIDGNWNMAAQNSLSLFNKNVGTKFDVKTASLDAFDAVRGKKGRVCPLICDHGYKADAGGCTKINCKAGFEVGDDNTCERTEPQRSTKPMAKRDQPVAIPKAADAKPTPSGTVFCGQGGCRPVRAGCRLVVSGGIGVGQYEYCPKTF